MSDSLGISQQPFQTNKLLEMNPNYIDEFCEAERRVREKSRHTLLYKREGCKRCVRS